MVVAGQGNIMKFGKSVRLSLVALMVGLMATLGLSSSASAHSSGPADKRAQQARDIVAKKLKAKKSKKAKPAPRLIHPCDVGNENGRLDSAIEKLCMQVWDHGTYDITDKDGYPMSTVPAGPVVVVEFVQQWRDEDLGINHLRDLFKSEVESYKEFGNG